MVDRFLVWLGAGILTAGVSAATIAGSGLATAEDGAAASAGGDTTSQSSNSVGAEADSDDNKTETDSVTDDEATDDFGVDVTDPVADADAEEEEANDPDVTDEDEATEEDEATDEAATDDKSQSGFDDHAPARTFLTVRDSAETSSGTERSAGALEADVKQADEDESEITDASTEHTAASVEPMSTLADADTTDVEDTAVGATFALEAAEEEPVPAAPTLINIVGTFFWGLFDLMSKVIDGPPVVPPGSTVTAGRSTLQIDCGDGYTADADWYFPTEGEPDKLIYLQHGFPGRAGVYNLTVAELAERNNAIVVASSITGNPFACDACNLTGDPMHAAVARLFEGDRSALIASAEAAGYAGTLPEQFVFVGHSHGGQLAAGAAGYFRDFAAADEKSDLVGALLLDSSAAGGALARALDKLPATFPVLHISAAPAPLNTFGSADAVFQQKRPGQFNGVQLVGGTHSDGFRSSAVFGLAQFVVGLATGDSTPENVEAVQVLAQGWITDMYVGSVYNPATRTGIYGEPGEPGETVIDIPTDAGLAHGYVLPAPTSQLTTLLALVFGTLFELPTAFNLDICAVDPSGLQAEQTRELTEMSTPNTALSLDGRAWRGQSVGQHVCTG